jgi:hypothetical protein
MPVISDARAEFKRFALFADSWRLIPGYWA